MNGEYLINRRYVCFRCNLNEKVEQSESPHKKKLSSLICSTKEKKTFKVLMTEKYHTQKISLIGCSLYKAHMRQRRRR